MKYLLLPCKFKYSNVNLQHEFGIRKSSSEFTKQIFFENYYKIQEHNERFENGEETFKMGLNQFSHMTYKNIVKNYFGLREHISKPVNVKVPQVPFDPSSLPNVTLPTQFSWRKKEGIIRPVQDQGGCGSCYIFASIGAIEGQLKLKYGFDTKLSEQEVLDCVQYNDEFLGCQGGWHYAVYDLVYLQDGVTSEEIYPYKAVENTCKPKKLTGRDSKVQSFVEIPNDAEIIQRVLYSQGPLYISYYASSSFMMYDKGIFTDPSHDCEGAESNHAVLLTGWGTENGIDYWELKNSWSDIWGENGFFRLERGVNLCNVEQDANHPNL